VVFIGFNPWTYQAARILTATAAVKTTSKLSTRQNR
jgi:hypothetical protein